MRSFQSFCFMLASVYSAAALSASTSFRNLRLFHYPDHFHRDQREPVFCSALLRTAHTPHSSSPFRRSVLYPERRDGSSPARGPEVTEPRHHRHRSLRVQYPVLEAKRLFRYVSRAKTAAAYMVAGSRRAVLHLLPAGSRTCLALEPILATGFRVEVGHMDQPDHLIGGQYLLRRLYGRIERPLT